MLLTLLPFAGFAADITEVKVTFGELAKATYDGHAAAALPTPSVKGDKGDGEEVLEEGVDYVVTYRNPLGQAITSADEIVMAGTYTVSVDNVDLDGDFEPAEGYPLAKSYVVAKKVLKFEALNPSITYGQSIPAETACYQLVEEVENEWCTEEDEALDPIDVDYGAYDLTTAGTKIFTLVANELVNYTIQIPSPSGVLSIAKKAATITINDINADKEVEYGTLIANLGVTYAYEGFLPGDVDAQGKPTGLGTLNYKVNQGLSTAPALEDVLPVDEDAYTIWPIVTDGAIPASISKNYNVTVVENTFKVIKKTLTASMIKTPKGKSLVYNGTDRWNDFKGLFTVEDGNLLTPETDITAVFYDGEHAIDGNTYKMQDAKDYTLKVDVLGAGNYKLAAPIEVTFTVDRKEISLRTQGDIYTYTNTTFKLDPKKHLKYMDAIATDINADGTITPSAGTLTLKLYDANEEEVAAAATAGGAKLNAGTYTIKAIPSVYAEEPATEALAYTNYTIKNIGNIGEVVVTPLELAIKPVEKSDAFGVENKFVTPVVATASDVVIGKLNAAGDDIVTPLEGLIDDFGNVFDADHKIMLSRDADETENINAVGKYTLKATVPEVDNYTFTVLDGVYRITASAINVWAKEATSVYHTAESDLKVVVQGMNATDKETAQAILEDYLYVDYDDENLDATTAPVGTYKVKINDGWKEALSSYASKYDVENAEFYDNDYKITKAALSIKIKNQAKIADNTNGETVTSSAEDNIDYVGDVLDIDKDALEAVIKLQFNQELLNTENGYVDGEGKLLAAAAQHGHDGDHATTTGVYVNGIVVDEATLTTYNNGEYNYTLATSAIQGGKLFVSTTAAVLYLDAKSGVDNTAAITAAAGKIVNVGFKNRKQTAEKWTVMVLPFETSVREISNALGYAVVDVLAKDKGDANNVYFKLHMGKIEANTPFLVKVDDNKTFPATTDENPTIFRAKEIVDVEDGKTAPVTNTAGANFYGVYKPTDVTGDRYLWLASNNSSDGSIKEGDWCHRASKATIPATKGYVELPETTDPSQEARVYVEEPDGSTTAIACINADGVAVEANGWYTLDGIKLQGVPAEKGIYIRNGKKMVIK